MSKKYKQGDVVVFDNGFAHQGVYSVAILTSGLVCCDFNGTWAYCSGVFEIDPKTIKSTLQDFDLSGKTISFEEGVLEYRIEPELTKEEVIASLQEEMKFPRPRCPLWDGFFSAHHSLQLRRSIRSKFAQKSRRQ